MTTYRMKSNLYAKGRNHPLSKPVFESTVSTPKRPLGTGTQGQSRSDAAYLNLLRSKEPPF